MATAASKTPERLQPVPKPNEKQYRDVMDLESKAIEELKAKINTLQQAISSVVGGRDEHNRRKNEKRARLDELQKQIDALEDRRKVILEKMQAKQKEGADMKQSASDLRKKIGFSSAEEVDKKIAALEMAMMTSTQSLKEEKQMLEDIKKLRLSKPLLGKYQTLEKGASNLDDTSIAPLRDMLEQVRTELLQLRTAKREEAASYKELMDQRNAATAPSRDLIDERDRLSKLMQDHFLKRRAAQEELNRETFKFMQYQKQVQRERDEKSREDRARRAAENERERLLEDLERVEGDVPYEDEVTLLRQTIKYVQVLIDPKANDVANPAASDLPKPVIPQDSKMGGQMLVNKKDRVEEFYFAPKQKVKAASTHEKKIKTKALKMDVATLAYFEQCGVVPPVLAEELPKCLEVLNEKLENLLNLQKDKIERVDSRKAAIQVQIDALDARMKENDKSAKKADVEA